MTSSPGIPSATLTFYRDDVEVLDIDDHLLSLSIVHSLEMASTFEATVSNTERGYTGLLQQGDEVEITAGGSGDEELIFVGQVLNIKYTEDQMTISGRDWSHLLIGPKLIRTWKDRDWGYVARDAIQLYGQGILTNNLLDTGISFTGIHSVNYTELLDIINEAAEQADCYWKVDTNQEFLLFPKGTSPKIMDGFNKDLSNWTCEAPIGTITRNEPLGCMELLVDWETVARWDDIAKDAPRAYSDVPEGPYDWISMCEDNIGWTWDGTSYTVDDTTYDYGLYSLKGTSNGSNPKFTYTYYSTQDWQAKAYLSLAMMGSTSQSVTVTIEDSSGKQRSFSPLSITTSWTTYTLELSDYASDNGLTLSIIKKVIIRTNATNGAYFWLDTVKVYEYQGLEFYVKIPTTAIYNDQMFGIVLYKDNPNAIFWGRYKISTEDQISLERLDDNLYYENIHDEPITTLPIWLSLKMNSNSITVGYSLNNTAWTDVHTQSVLGFIPDKIGVFVKNW